MPLCSTFAQASSLPTSAVVTCFTCGAAVENRYGGCVHETTGKHEFKPFCYSCFIKYIEKHDYDLEFAIKIPVAATQEPELN